MSITANNLNSFIGPGVVSDQQSWGALFGGLIDHYGRRAIDARFSEANPPANKETTNTDTARAEQLTGPAGFIQNPATVKVGLAVAALVGVALLVVVLKD